MRNFFLPEAPAPERRPQHPVPFSTAFAYDGPNVPKPSRALRRKGLAYLHEIAAHPKRHTVCKPCGRRTFTSAGGTCRRCFLAGDGGLEVSF